MLIKKSLFTIILCALLSTHAQQHNIVRIFKLSTLEIPQQRNDYILGLKKANAQIRQDIAVGSFLGITMGSLFGLGISYLCNGKNSMHYVGAGVGALGGLCIGYGITSSDSHKESIYCSFENYSPLNNQFKNLTEQAYECNDDMLDLLIASNSTDAFIKHVQIERSLFQFPLIYTCEALKRIVFFCQKVDATLSLIFMQHNELKNTQKELIEQYLQCAKETTFLLKKTIAEFKDHPAYLREVDAKLATEMQETERIKLESEIKLNREKAKCQKAKAEESFAKTVETWHELLFSE